VDIRLPDALLCVPEGEYRMVYAKHEYRTMFKGQNKLIMTLRISEMTEHCGKQFERFYNVERSGKAYKSLQRSDFQREMADVFRVRSFKGIRLFSELKGFELLVDVRNVSIDSKQQSLSDHNLYSVVARIKGRVD